MRIYIARHAETTYNLLNLCNGDPDIDVALTSDGIEQAKNLALDLRSIEFDLIITSDLPRTKETAKIVNRYHKRPIISDSRINDVLTGFEGRPVEDFLRARWSAHNPQTIRLNGGESIRNEKERVRDFLHNLRDRPEQCIVVITHHAIARHIYAQVHNLSNDEKVNTPKMNNTDYFEFSL